MMKWPEKQIHNERKKAINFLYAQQIKASTYCSVCEKSANWVQFDLLKMICKAQERYCVNAQHRKLYIIEQK